MDRWNPWAQPTRTLEITQLYRQIKQGGPYKTEVIARLFLFLSSPFQPDKKENLNKNLDEEKPLYFLYIWVFMKQGVPRLHDNNHWVKTVQESLIIWITQKTKNSLKSQRLQHEGSGLTVVNILSISQCSFCQQSRLNFQQHSQISNYSLNLHLPIPSLRLTCSAPHSSTAKSNFCHWEGDIVSNFFLSSVTWVYTLEPMCWKLNSIVVY